MRDFNPKVEVYDEGLSIKLDDVTIIFKVDRENIKDLEIYNKSLTEDEIKERFAKCQNFGLWVSSDANEKFLLYKIGQQQKRDLAEKILQKWKGEMTAVAMQYGPKDPQWPVYCERLRLHSDMIKIMADELVEIIEKEIEDRKTVIE